MANISESISEGKRISSIFLAGELAAGELAAGELADNFSPVILRTRNAFDRCGDAAKSHGFPYFLRKELIRQLKYNFRL